LEAAHSTVSAEPQRGIVHAQLTFAEASAPVSGFGEGVLVFAVWTALSAGITTSLMLRAGVGAAGAAGVASCGGALMATAAGLGGAMPFCLLAAGPVGGRAGTPELGAVVRLAPGGTYALGLRWTPEYLSSSSFALSAA